MSHPSKVTLDDCNIFGRLSWMLARFVANVARACAITESCSDAFLSHYKEI